MHIKTFLTTVSAAVLITVANPVSAQGNGDAIARAVADTSRPTSHTARDAKRHPAKILKAAGVKPGDTVADLGAFGGYYTALLSRVVGAEGTVYAMDYGLAIEKLPQFNLGRLTPAYMQQDPRENVVFTVQKRFDALKATKPLDAAFIVQHYHDTIWTGEDRIEMGKAILRALKPGGRFVVIDHSAVAGAGEQVSQTLHRVDPARVRSEMLAAGFELAGDYDYLANPDDARDLMIANPAIRGKTDRFVLVFQKPG